MTDNHACNNGLLNHLSVLGYFTMLLFVFIVKTSECMHENVIIKCEPYLNRELYHSPIEDLSILIHPVSQTECYYRTVSFFVKASGENLHFAWERKLPGKSFVLIPDGDVKVSYPSPGYITIKDVGTSANPDGTEYRVIVSDGSSSVVSQSATLTINRITGIYASTSPANSTQIRLCAGSDFSWSVITNYPENVTGYQWMKYFGPNDWRPVVDDECISGSQTDMLHFNGIRTENSGRYYVSIRFKSSAVSGCTVSSQSNYNRQIEVFVPSDLVYDCPLPELYYPANDSGYYLGDLQVEAISECGPVVLNYIVGNENIAFPYRFESGSTSVSVIVPSLPEIGTLCSFIVNVGDYGPPDFEVSLQPLSFCQSLPEYVAFGEIGIELDPGLNDIILKGPELAVFDLDPHTFKWNDRMCLLEELKLHWVIEFSGVEDPLDADQIRQFDPVSGTGQPGTSNLEICLPGRPAGSGKVEHLISYWLEDCHGIKSDLKSVPIIIFSRPEIVLSTGNP